MKRLFAFNSELCFHKTVHHTIPIFKCMSKKCGKMYKSANELNKHVLKHSGMVWDCDAKNCEYSMDDRRNLNAHKRKHQKSEVLSADRVLNTLKFCFSLYVFKSFFLYQKIVVACVSTHKPLYICWS